MPKTDWETLAASIGPLRYQTSKADCVPTTIINALLVLHYALLPPKLVKQVWAIGLDFPTGTGWVGTKLLADLLDAWFNLAVRDRQARSASALRSFVIEGKKVNLGKSGVIRTTLDNGGVCCLTVRNGQHYVLLLANDGDDYLIFDPTWRRSHTTTDHIERFRKYFGLVNTILTKEELLMEFDSEYNKYVHVIAHAANSEA